MKLRNPNDFKMGEFIDCEHYIHSNNRLEVVRYMYRTEGTLPELGAIEDAPYEIVIYAFNKYMEWRNDLFDRFSNLFQSEDNKEENRRVLAALGLKETEEEIEEDESEKEWRRTWGWYEILFKNICGEDFLKMEQAYNQYVVATFSHLSYLMARKK